MTSKYKIYTGTVQCYVAMFDEPPFLHHFGRAQYDSKKPILSESLRRQAAPIIEMLNGGCISEEDARKKLDKLWT